MGQSSQAGYVAFMTQASPDVFPAGFNSSAIAMKLRTGGLGTNRELLIPDPEIGGGRDVNDAYLGPVSFSGDLEFYARFNALLPLLNAALGIKYVKTPGGTNGVQTLTMTGTPTGGTFTLTYNAQTTAAIPYNATAQQVGAALEALSTVDEGEFDVTGGPFPATPILVKHYGKLVGTVTAITASSVGLTGGTSPTVTPTTSTAGTAFTVASKHTFLPSDAAQLPFLAIQERIGASLETYNYTDGVINTFHMEADADGYLMGTVGVIARKQIAGVTGMPGYAAAFDNLPMVVGTNITVTKAGVTLPAKSFSIDVNNQFEDDDYRLGSFYIGDLTPKRREVTLGFSIREQDSALWREAAYGSSAATAPGGLSNKSEVTINMETYEPIPGAGGSLKYGLKLTFPTATPKPYTLEASGDDIIESDVELQALRPNPQRKLVIAEVTTDLVTVA